MSKKNQPVEPKKNNSGDDYSMPQGNSDQYEGRLRFHLCLTLSCIMEKNIRSCYECDEFPCPKVRDE